MRKKLLLLLIVIPLSACRAIAIKNMTPVLFGQGVPESADYNSDSQVPPKIIIVDVDGKRNKWNSSLPSEWSASNSNEVQLVVVLEEDEVNLGTNNNYVGPSITRYRHDIRVSVHEAKTGAILAITNIEGKDPDPFPKTALYDQTRIDGEEVSFDQLMRWLLEIPEMDSLIPLGYLFQFDEDDRVRSIAYSPSGEYFAVGFKDGNIEVIQPAEGSGSIKLEGHSEEVTGLSYSYDGSLLASASLDDTIRIWRTSDWELLFILDDHESSVYSVDFSPNGTTLVTSSRDKSLKIWDAKDGTLITTIPHEDELTAIRTVSYSPVGDLIGYNWENYIHLWGIDAGDHIYSIEHDFNPRADYIEDFDISPNGAFLASTTSTEYVWLWDFIEGTLISRLSVHQGHAEGITFSPDSQLLASGSYKSEYSIMIWSVPDGEELVVLGNGFFDQQKDFVFSPDGKTLAVSSGDRVFFWDVDRLLGR